MSTFWKLSNFPRSANPLPRTKMNLMTRKRRVSCSMSQEKPSSTQVVDCVSLGAVTLEGHQSVMGDRAKEFTRQPDAPSVVFYNGNGTKDSSVGVLDLPCVVGGKHTQIRMHVVPGEAPCLLSKGWLKEHGAVLNASSAELVLRKKQITAPMTEGPSGHFELGLCPRERDFGRGRTGTVRPSPSLCRRQKSKDSPSTPLRALVTRWKIMIPKCSLFPWSNIP